MYHSSSQGLLGRVVVLTKSGGIRYTTAFFVVFFPFNDSITKKPQNVLQHFKPGYPIIPVSYTHLKNMN